MKIGPEKDIEIGRRLKQLRRGCKMSQLTAAKALGVTQSCISQLECGRRSVSAAAAARFAELYGVSPAEIYGETPAGRISAAPSPGRGRDMLEELTESSGAEKLINSVNAYTALSIYRMLRAVYSLNPHNTQELFSIPQEEADRLTAEFLRDEPHRIASLNLAGSKKDRSRIELPPEQSAELRRFIEECEALLVIGKDKP